LEVPNLATGLYHLHNSAAVGWGRAALTDVNIEIPWAFDQSVRFSETTGCSAASVRRRGRSASGCATWARG